MCLETILPFITLSSIERAQSACTLALNPNPSPKALHLQTF